MGSVVNKVTDTLGITDTRDAGDKAVKAASIQSKAQLEGAKMAAETQRQALEYMKEREALPQEFREGALTEMANLYGLRGSGEAQAAMLARAMEDPIYQAVLSGQQAEGARAMELGEEAIMRNAAMTGGLRSGNTQAAFGELGQNLAIQQQQQRNQALANSYGQQLSGLQSLSQLPSNVNQIAAQQSQIGATLGAGTSAAGQSRALGLVAQGQANVAADNATTEKMLGKADAGTKAYSAGMFSDPRLKDNIVKIGERGGLSLYSWDWNEEAGKLGLYGRSTGVMADEVEAKYPEAVTVQNGYKKVSYKKLAEAIH